MAQHRDLQSSTTLISTTQPLGPVDLPACDALHIVHYIRHLHLFRLPPTTQDPVQQHFARIVALTSALQALVSRFPVLASTVVPNGTRCGKKAVTFTPGPGLVFVVRDLRTRLPDFDNLELEDYQPHRLPYDLLIPVPKGVGNEEPCSTCWVQYSALRGGSVVAFCMSHSVGDGGAADVIVGALAEELRRVQQRAGGEEGGEGGEATRGVDRREMKAMESRVPFRIEDHPGYSAGPLELGSRREEGERHPFAATVPEHPFLIHIPASKIAQLKADATLDIPSSASSAHDEVRISTHDALLALLWRTILSIRSRRGTASPAFDDATTTTSLFFPTSARSFLPTLPERYIGNVIYQLKVTLPLATLLSPSTGLAEAACAVRRALNARTPDLVASLMAQVERSWVTPAWEAEMETLGSTGVAVGTHWTSGKAMYEEQDWGPVFGGCMERFRLPGEEGLNAVMPRLRDGSAEVVVSVTDEEVDQLTAEVWKYAWIDTAQA